MAKRKHTPVDQWIQLPLFPDTERNLQRSNAANTQPDLPGWIGFPIRFGGSANPVARGK